MWYQSFSLVKSRGYAKVRLGSRRIKRMDGWIACELEEAVGWVYLVCYLQDCTESI